MAGLGLSLGLGLTRNVNSGGPNILTAPSLSPETAQVGTEVTRTQGTYEASGGGSVTITTSQFVIIGGGDPVTAASITPDSFDAGKVLYYRETATETGGTNPGTTTTTISLGEIAAIAPTTLTAPDWTLTDPALGGTLRVSIPTENVDDGGSPITLIEYRLDGGTAVDTGLEYDFDITGLTDSTEYDVEIRLTNEIGDSGWSDLKSETPSAASTVPSAFVLADWDLSDPGTDGDLQVTINSLPSNGGEEITNIKYELDNSGTLVAANRVTDFIIPGLTNGQEYDVQIYAVNLIGDSLESDVKSETPTDNITADVTGGTITFENVGDGDLEFTITDPDRSWTDQVVTQSAADADEGTQLNTSMFASGPIILDEPILNDDGSPATGETLTIIPPIYANSTANGSVTVTYATNGANSVDTTDPDNPTLLVDATDAGVSLTVTATVTDSAGGRDATSNAVAIPGGAFTPADLFGVGDDGFWYDFSDDTTLWQDTSATTAVTTTGDDVARVDDKSGNGNNATLGGIATAAPWHSDGYLDVAAATNSELQSAYSNNATAETVVIAYKGTGDNGLLVSTASSAPRWYLQQRTSALRYAYGGQTPGYTCDHTGHVALMAYDANNTEGWRILHRLNGADELNSTSTETIGTGAYSVPDSGFKPTADIYQVVAIDRPLTSSEIADLEAYFATKLGISL